MLTPKTHRVLQFNSYWSPGVGHGSWPRPVVSIPGWTLTGSQGDGLGGGEQGRYAHTLKPPHLVTPRGRNQGGEDN